MRSEGPLCERDERGVQEADVGGFLCAFLMLYNTPGRAFLHFFVYTVLRANAADLFPRDIRAMVALSVLVSTAFWGVLLCLLVWSLT